MRLYCHLLAALLLVLGAVRPVAAQMVTGASMPGYAATMGLSKAQESTAYKVTYYATTVSGNILWPGEQGKFSFQLANQTDQPIQVSGKVDLIQYATKGQPGEIWVPQMFKIADLNSVPVTVDIAAKGFTNITITPAVPAKLGAYALVFDLGQYGRCLGTVFVRTFKADSRRVQFPKLGCDVNRPDVLHRLGCKSIRIGQYYKPTTDKDFNTWLADFGQRMKIYQANNVMIIVEIGGGVPQVFGRMRSHLDDKGVGPMGYPGDGAWMPSADADFSKFCKIVAGRYGYPKGPITAFKIWNEPWEGSSIAGWGADIPRFREITVAMGKGIEAARAEDKVQVLMGGTDSSSNTFDKFFADGSNDFLKYLDFCSIHYQGMAPPSTVKAWVNRKSPYGRVKIWDTESWVANTDDRVAAVMAANMSTGHDRAVGVYGGNITEDNHYGESHKMRGADGKEQPVDVTMSWSVAASVGAAQHFLGERDFKELLFRNGLPWVMLFNGLKDAQGRMNSEDSTAVVVGDLGEEFGPDNMMFRTARGLYEVKHRDLQAKLKAQLNVLPATAPDAQRHALEMQLSALQILRDATMTLQADGTRYALYDFYGNLVPAHQDKIAVPLDGRGFFLRGDGRPGSFALLVQALRTARIDGIEPLATVAHDMTAPLNQHPTLRLSLTNVLNRPVTGTLSVTLGNLRLNKPHQVLTINGNETRQVALKVSGVARADNTYPLTLKFDAGNGLITLHQENMHVNYIARRTIQVDGKLDDWKGILPQNIVVNDKAGPSVTEAAWQPYKKFDTSVKQGLSSGYLAYDDKFFYFAAKIADTTPDEGMLRYATRHDDDYFYPPVAYTPSSQGGGTSFAIRWTGQVMPKYGEAYTFTTTSDDGVRLWVNGQQLVDNWTAHGPTDDSGTIALKAGQGYNIRMEYYNGEGGGTAKLYWSSLSQAKEIIPAERLYPTAQATVAGGLTGDYFNGRSIGRHSALTRIDKTIAFDYAEHTYPDPAIKNAPPELEALVWPAGVRRYTYRKDPDLPAGNAPNKDNVQIAFNVLPPEQKDWYPNPPGTMPGYTAYRDTDYEYALNPVAAKYGGGTEIWRLQHPGMPHKHFYPREPKSPLDGPIRGGKLVITRDANTRYVEAAIPWAEIPDVKKNIDTGKPIKFSYRVNDNGWAGCMELSKQRSVAKRNGSFTVDWAEHWANELEFGAQQ